MHLEWEKLKLLPVTPGACARGVTTVLNLFYVRVDPHKNFATLGLDHRLNVQTFQLTILHEFTAHAQYSV